LGAGEDVAGVGGQEGGEDHAGQTEEDEHPLADSRVVPGDRERVGAVVDEVVLAGRDGGQGVGDPLGLVQGATGVRAQP
jgi:hypothetical protein